MPQRPEPELRHLALQIATMLPQDPTEARQVLKRVAELLDLALDDTKRRPLTTPRTPDAGEDGAR